MHWISNYLTLKWSNGGRGPFSFDCWGLLRDVYEKQLGVSLDEYPGVDAEDRKKVAGLLRDAINGGHWEQLDRPEHLCGVALSMNSRMHHVGVFIDIDGGLVLHSSKAANVLAQSIPSLRASGYRKMDFYRYGNRS